MSSPPLRVLVVDDHAVVRSGLRLLLETDEGLEVVGEAGDLSDAVFEARALKPDVIVMDVVMPGGSGIEATAAVLKEAPNAKVLVLSMQDDPRYVREAFAAGATGYVLKEAADSELLGAVREVAGGGHYVDPELGARLVSAEAAERASAAADPLSNREREVLRLLARGYTNQEIAKTLYLGANGRNAPRQHPAEAPDLDTRRACELCDRPRIARGGLVRRRSGARPSSAQGRRRSPRGSAHRELLVRLA